MDYKQKSKQVAKELIGRKIYANELKAEIIETEAYEGGEPTKSRECMNYSPGQIGIMPFRGLNFINIGTEKSGVASCVLVRSIKVGDEIIEGPGKVGKSLDAKSLEYKLLGKDVPLTGRTKPSKFHKNKGSSENSLGRYSIK